MCFSSGIYSNSMYSIVWRAELSSRASGAHKGSLAVGVRLLGSEANSGREGVQRVCRWGGSKATDLLCGGMVACCTAWAVGAESGVFRSAWFGSFLPLNGRLDSFKKSKSWVEKCTISPCPCGNLGNFVEKEGFRLGGTHIVEWANST